MRGRFFTSIGSPTPCSTARCRCRNLIDDRGEQLPAHVGRRLELLIGARTGGAEQIAAVGGLQIEADRLVLRHIAVGPDAFEIAPWDRPVVVVATFHDRQFLDRLCRRPLSARDCRLGLQRAVATAVEIARRRQQAAACNFAVCSRHNAARGHRIGRSGAMLRRKVRHEAAASRRHRRHRTMPAGRALRDRSRARVPASVRRRARCSRRCPRTCRRCAVLSPSR